MLLRAGLHVSIMAHNYSLCQTSRPINFMISNGSHVVSIVLVSLLMTVSESVTNIVLSLLQYYRKTCILSKCCYNIYTKCYCARFGQLCENIAPILCACWVSCIRQMDDFCRMHGAPIAPNASCVCGLGNNQSIIYGQSKFT